MGVGWSSQSAILLCGSIATYYYSYTAGCLRRWIKGIRNKLPKEKRGEFNIKVVKKTKRANGTGFGKAIAKLWVDQQSDAMSKQDIMSHSPL